MSRPHTGRWAIIETTEIEYSDVVTIRCFFENEEAARDRWTSYNDYERMIRDVRFVNYGDTYGF